MGKVLAIALAAAVIFFVVHSRGANAAKVTSCLSHAGAMVRQSTFLEDHLSTASGRAENSQLEKKLRDADKNLWEVKLTDDQGLLMHLDHGYSAKDVRERVGGTVQGSGRIVMLWYSAPTDASRQAVERCLH
jgi:hypothetical protein